MAEVKVCYAYLNLVESQRFTATRLRGYLGYLFIEDTEFHHHMENPYHYPLVQYKMIEGTKPVIMGLADYADVLFRKISSLDKVVMPDNVVKVSSVELRRETFRVEDEQNRYQFLTPWIALNEENHRKFIQLDYGGKAELLKKILIGNILSMLKGLKIFIDYHLEVAIDNARPFKTRAHDNIFWAFKPEFSANVRLPQYAGLGKSVSKGFGAIEAV